MRNITILITLLVVILLFNSNYSYSESHIITQKDYAPKSKITFEDIEYTIEIGKGDSIGFFKDNHTFLLNLHDCKSFTTQEVCFTKKTSNTSIELITYNTKPSLTTSMFINKSNLLIGQTRTIKIEIRNEGFDTAKNVKFTQKIPSNINIISKEKNIYIKNNQIYWHGDIDKDKKKELWYEIICNQSNKTKITGNVTYNNKETDRIINIDEYSINCEIPFIINTSINVNKTKIGDNFTYSIFIKNNNTENEKIKNISIQRINFEDLSCCNQQTSSNYNPSNPQRIIYSKKIETNKTLEIPTNLLVVNSDNKNIKISIEYILYNTKNEQINKKPYRFTLSNYINISKIPLNCYIDILPKKIISLSNFSIIANCNIPYTTNRYTTPNLNITSKLFAEEKKQTHHIKFDKTFTKNYTTPFTDKDIEETLYFNISYTDKFLNLYKESKEIKINILKYTYPTIKKNIIYKTINDTKTAYLNISLTNTANHNLTNITITEKNRYYNNLSKTIKYISINQTKEIFLISLNDFLIDNTKNLTYLDSLTTLNYNIKNQNITNKQPRIIDLGNINEELFPKQNKNTQNLSTNTTTNTTNTTTQTNNSKKNNSLTFLTIVFIIFIIFILVITFIFKKTHKIKTKDPKPKMPEEISKENKKKETETSNTNEEKKENTEEEKDKNNTNNNQEKTNSEEKNKLEKMNLKNLTQIKNIKHYLEFSKSRLEIYNLEKKEIEITSTENEEKVKLKNIIQEIEEKISLVLKNIDTNPELIELATTLEKEYIKAKNAYELYDNTHQLKKKDTKTNDTK